MAIFDPESKEFYCECGCGTPILGWNRFATGHWMKTKEGRQKSSETHSGKVLSTETRAAISEAKFGTTQSEHTKTLISESLRANPPFRGRRHTEKTKAQISRAIEELWKDPSYRASVEESVKANWNDPDKVEVFLASIREFHSRPSYRALARKNSLELWKDSSYREIVLEGMALAWADPTLRTYASQRAEEAWEDPNRLPNTSFKPNMEEMLLGIWLRKGFPDKFVSNITIQKKVGSKRPDYVDWINRQIVELFGTFYHSEIYFPSKLTEEELVGYYKQRGFDCVVVWGDEVYNQELVISKVKGVLDL